MRKRITADIDMSAKDMVAFIELIAQRSTSFTMQDLDDLDDEPQRTNGHTRRSTPQVFPKELMVRLTSRSTEGLPPHQRAVHEALKAKFGDKPFRKGDGSSAMVTKLGTGASSSMTHLCRSGHLAPA